MATIGLHVDREMTNRVLLLLVAFLGAGRCPVISWLREQMKKLLLVVAACAIATPALAQRAPQSASRDSISNSARVEQMAGAFAFNQIGQGERVTLESPRSEPLIQIDGGAFVLPYFSNSFNATRGGEIRIYDPVGSFIRDTQIDMQWGNPG